MNELADWLADHIEAAPPLSNDAAIFYFLEAEQEAFVKTYPECAPGLWRIH